MKAFNAVLILILVLAIFFIIVSCNMQEQGNVSPTPPPPSEQNISPTPDNAQLSEPTQISEPTASPEPTNLPQSPTQVPDKDSKPIDYSIVQPNESGDIPIVMFHNFIENLDDTTDNFYTTSFTEFEVLLETLYDQGYRLISMRDFIDHNISVPAGKKPMVFSFDDGSPGQFNLIEQGGKLVVNPKSAVGAILKFNEKHPDFGMKGIFYLNMDLENKTFEGEGTLKERLDILLSYGFEIGNHSWGHFDFSTATNKQQINEKLGKNEKSLGETMDGVEFYSFALPFGNRPPESLRDAMVNGSFEGVKYNNQTIMAVGAQPSMPSTAVNYNPAYVGRIRAQGKLQEDFDLTYWIPKMTKARMYISDGDASTVVVPEAMATKIDAGKLNGKKLIKY